MAYSDNYPELPDNAKRFIDALSPVETIIPVDAPTIKDPKTGKRVIDPSFRYEKTDATRPR